MASTVTKQTFSSIRNYKKSDWEILKTHLTDIVASLSRKHREDPDVKEITAWILYGLAGVLRAKPKEDREQASLDRYLWGAAKRRVRGYFHRHGRFVYLADDELIPLVDAKATTEDRLVTNWFSDTLELLPDDAERLVARYAAESSAASVASTSKSKREANAQYQRNHRAKEAIQDLVLREAKGAGIGIPARVHLILKSRNAARAAAKSATR